MAAKIAKNSRRELGYGGETRSRNRMKPNPATPLPRRLVTSFGNFFSNSFAIYQNGQTAKIKRQPNESTLQYPGKKTAKTADTHENNRRVFPSLALLLRNGTENAGKCGWVCPVVRDCLSNGILAEIHQYCPATPRAD